MRAPLPLSWMLLPAFALAWPALAGAPPAPWWERETAMDEKGQLVLAAKPWWARALALASGEHFAATSGADAAGKMLIRRERLTIKGKPLDAIVWVIDDDGDLRPEDKDGDKDSDCYVADYDADGRADRLVDYLDNDGDGKPDEMEIRYFLGGRLRRAWFGVDLDKDSLMWDVVNYEYSGNFFRSDPHGDNLIYANEYDPERKAWVPHSECPFAFYDTDRDGQSEAVVRFSAVPLDFDGRAEPDYANSIFSYSGPFTERMRRVGVLNVRYSLDIDGLSSAERPLHYELGFNMIGRLPYEFAGMARENCLRRPPKTTFCIPHADARRVAESYPADQTGFSWREYGDDAVALGGPPHPEEDRRWEGVFWTWARRVMHNTGGPVQDWNVRREFRPSACGKRELYYCRADRRIHLRGATEGWLCVGHLGNGDRLAEIRYLDTNGDGHFDRWETWLHGAAAPARVSTPLDPGIRPLPDDWAKLQELYTRELLPEALQANEKLVKAMQPLLRLEPPQHLAKALAAASCDTERRYVQDVIRELHYLAVRDKLAKRASELLAAAGLGVPRRDPQRLAASEKAWAYARTLSLLDAAYGEGRCDDAIRLIKHLQALDRAPAADPQK
ncbi:MAG TPA: hypothetical protein VNE39_05080 [Planctomycetota bacterium]|nr:hypothetical protein [Planctomycetota bacterium]